MTSSKITNPACSLQLHWSFSKQDGSGEGEVAVLPQAMGSEFMLHVPEHDVALTRKGKRNPLGHVCTCWRSEKLRGETIPWSLPGLMQTSSVCNSEIVTGT